MGNKKPYHHGDLANALADAAFSVMSSEGTQAVSLRSCALAVGVDASAAYRHYSSKDAILAAAAQRGFDALGNDLERAMNRVGADPRKRIIALGVAYVVFASKQPILFRSMFAYAAQALGPPPQAAARRSAFGMLVEAIDALAAAAELPANQRPGLELVFWSPVHGLAELVASGLAPLEGAALRRTATRACEAVLIGTGLDQVKD